MGNRLLSKANISYRTAGEKPSIGIDVSADLIKFKIDVQYEEYPQVFDETEEPVLLTVNKTIYNIEIPLSELKKKANYKSNTLFGVHYKNENSEKISVIDRDFINISAETYEQRVLNPFAMTLVNQCYIAILVKDPDGDFNDFDIIAFVPNNDKLTFISNEQFTEYDKFDINHVLMLDDISAQKDTSYINDEYIKINVSSQPYVDEVFVENIVGITDKTRVKLTNGSGSFRILKSSVEDQYDVRLGFASYPRLTAITGTV